MKVVTAGSLARNYGAKMVVYGGAGIGKTPIVNSAPNPLLIVHEPGMQSMQHSKVPAIEALDTKTAIDVYRWLGSSADVKKYDTICVDSTSELAEMFLTEAKNKLKDKRQHYGYAHDMFMPIMRQLFYMQYKHVYLIAKLGTQENGKKQIIENNMMTVETVMQKVPLYPGQAIGAAMRHLFDQILFMDWFKPPNYNSPVKAFFTVGCDEFVARDRTGKLAAIEPADNLTAIINKIMA